MSSVMISRYLLGLLAFAQATALALQTGNHVARTCDGDDCQVQATARNHSEVASDRFVCECCWRECDFSQDDTKDFRKEGEVDDESLKIPGYGENQESWNVGDRMDNIDAWIIVNGRRDRAWGVYLPIVETVKQAIEASGGVAAIIGAYVPVQQAMVEGVKIGVSQGRRPLVFTIGHEMWGLSIYDTLTLLKQASDAGAYLVAYQAEPGFDAHGKAAGRMQHKTLDLAKLMGAHEVWEYSMANINHYPEKPDRPIIRYVPPGYVRKLDVGVDVNSHLMQPASIAYMGQTEKTRTNVKTMNQKYLEMFGARLTESNDIWTTDDLRTFLETHPIQLNQHRWQTCCPREPWEAQFQHLEAFRMASLLANKACVISGPSAEEDMKLWQGMVTFAEVEDTLSTVERLSKNLQGCRLNSYETFKREFAPKAVLSRSGFFEVWRPPHGI